MSDIFTEFEKAKAGAAENNSTTVETPREVSADIGNPSAQTSLADEKVEPGESHSAQTDDGEKFTDLEDEKDLTPRELERYKKWQADYTKKRQLEKAEVKRFESELKKYEGLDDATVDVVRQINQKLKTNPAEALSMIEQIRQNIQQQVQPSQQADPLASFVPQTDAEYYLAEKIRSMEQQFQKVAPVVNELQTQNQQAQYNMRIEHEFNTLETKLNTKLPPDQRQALHDFATQNKLTSMEHAYKIANFEKAQQEATNKAATVVTRKVQSAPVPTTVTTRETAAGPTMPDSIHEIYRLAKEQATR